MRDCALTDPLRDPLDNRTLGDQVASGVVLPPTRCDGLNLRARRHQGARGFMQMRPGRCPRNRCACARQRPACGVRDGSGALPPRVSHNRSARGD